MIYEYAAVCNRKVLWYDGGMETPPCPYPGCDCPAKHICENCDTRFCPDHGSPGADGPFSEDDLAYSPAMCWKCGGFNVDE